MQTGPIVHWAQRESLAVGAPRLGEQNDVDELVTLALEGNGEEEDQSIFAAVSL
jgi:hypothetical protein